MKLWAPLGAISILVATQGWARWLLSDEATPTPHGPDSFSTGKLVFMRVVEVSSFLLALYLIWRFLLKPLIRQRTLTFDGMFILASIFLWFYDPLDNFLNYSFAYNTHLVSIGSWANFIPGYKYPNQNLLSEGLLLIGGVYVWYLLGMSIGGCWIIRRLKARYPNMTLLGLFGSVFAAVTVFDFCLEVSWIRAELMAYPGAGPNWQVIAPGQYQFPLFEAMTIGIFSLGLTAIRYFRDDRGQSFAEHGVDKLRVPHRMRKAISFLSITGFLHVWVLFGLYLPYQMMPLNTERFPPLPSYLRAGICGEGTTYACPSKYVPIPTRGSIHIRPDDDPRLPQEVRDAQAK